MPFTINYDKKEWALASAVVDNVAIKDVALTEASISVERTLLESSKAPCAIDLKPFFGGYRLIDKRVLVVDVGLSVKYLLTSEAGAEVKGKTLAQIEIKMSVSYDLPPPPIPAEVKRGFGSFSMYNGLFNCWPFFRQHVSYLSNSIRLPFMLPVLRLVPQDTGSTFDAGKPKVNSDGINLSGKKAKKKVRKAPLKSAGRLKQRKSAFVTNKKTARKRK